MTRINIFSVLSLTALVAATLLLSACGSGGSGYSRPGDWDFSSRTVKTPAEQPPRTLANVFQRPVEPRSPGTGTNTAADTTQQAGYTPPIQPELPPVKVALLLPLSGEHESLGQSMLHAAQVALFDAGHNSFELIPYDTQGTPGGAREAAEAVTRDGAQLILGPVFAQSVEAVRPIAARRNINVIAFSTDWTVAGGNTFIMGFLPFDQVERIVNFAAAQGLNSYGVIAPHTSYGDSVVGAYNRLAKQKMLETVDTLRFAPRTSNLAPDLRRFTQYDARLAQAENPLDPTQKPTSALGLEAPFEAVLMPVGGDQALAIANLMSHYDLPPNKVKRLGTGLFDDQGLANESGLDGAWFAAPSPRLREAFERRFQNLYGYPPPRLSTLAYDATALAAVLARRGLQNGGQPAFAKSDIMNPNGFAGIDGIFRFQSNGTAQRGLAILEFKNRRISVVEDAPQTFE